MKDTFKPLDEKLDADGLRVAIVVSRYNDKITTGLLAGATDALKKHGVDEEQLKIVSVPGAFEIPVAALHLAETGAYDALVCLGAVLRGETPHFDYIAAETTRGVMNTALTTGVPCGFGLLTIETTKQGEERSKKGPQNKGYEAAEAALEMALHLGKIAA